MLGHPTWVLYLILFVNILQLIVGVIASARMGYRNTTGEGSRPRYDEEAMIEASGLSREDFDKAQRCGDDCKVNKWVDTAKKTGWWMACQRACILNGKDPAAWLPPKEELQKFLRHRKS